MFNEGSRAAIYGIGTYIRELVTGLSEYKDISVNLVQLRSEKDEFTIEKGSGHTIYYFPNTTTSYNRYQKQEWYYRNIWFILCQYIKPNKQDQLFFHLNYHQEPSLVALIKQRFPVCRTIFTIHYQNWAFTLNGNTSQFKRIIKSTKEQLTTPTEKSVFEMYEQDCALYQQIDNIICLGQYAKRLLIKNYEIAEDKITVIPNGLTDDAIVLSDTQRKRLRAELHIPENEKVILFVGRLDDIKGVDILIEAFNLVVKKEPDCHLFIIGDGRVDEYQGKIENCWRKITFTGRLKKEDVYRFYQIADIGIMPSRYEPFGYVAIEMMMFDIPIIVAKTSGLNEIIKENINGWKIPVKEKKDNIDISAQSLKDKILEAVEGSKKRQQLKSKHVFQKNYTTQQMTRKYLKLINT
jgi:glycosyltransferase